MTHSREFTNLGSTIRTSHSFIIKIPLDKEWQRDIAEKEEMIIRLKSLNGGGLAIYGRDFGRYPFDVSLVIKK